MAADVTVEMMLSATDTSYTETLTMKAKFRNPDGCDEDDWGWL